MLSYQQQNTTQTLAEGVSEYSHAYQAILKHRKSTPEAERFFLSHDTVHVVFGCDVSLSDELIVKISSMFGTSEGLAVMRGYQLEDSKDIYDELKLRDILSTTGKAIFLVPRTLWRCLQMHNRWPWEQFDDQLDRPLCDIRKEFGITVANSSR